MRIVVWGSKGGTGKTTLAASVAAELTARGERALGVDLDSQRSLAAWGGLTDSVDVMATDATGLCDLLEKRIPYQHIVIDTPGRDTQVSRAALLVADLVVAPIGATPVDFAATKASLHVLAAAAEHRGGDLPVRFVRNRFDPRRRFARQAEDVLALMGFRCSTATLGTRVDYEALLAGIDLPPGGKARNEIHDLVNELENLHARSHRAVA